MNIYVFDKTFQSIGVIDSYSSLIWSIRYLKCGDFELYLPVDIKMLSMLRNDFYLCRAQDIRYEGNSIRLKHVMIIEKIEISADSENGNYMTISGRCLKSLLKRRIIWQQTSLRGKVETCMRQLITDNIISPEIRERKIDNFRLAAMSGLAGTMDRQFTGNNMGDVIEELCQTYGYGYDVDVVDGAFEFYLYQGADRSYNQSENPYVVFADQFENLLYSDYVYDQKEYKNVALIGGEGEGIERKMQTVGMAAGMDRYELFVDARNVSTNDEDISEDDYNVMLQGEGYEKLSEYHVKENFEGEVETQLTYKLNIDYFLGDIVQVRNEYGIEATPRILEIIDSDSEAGRQIIPTFGTWEA